MPTAEERLVQEIQGWGLEFFSPTELLTLGAGNDDPGHKGYGKNHLPTLTLLRALKPSAMALDTVRKKVGLKMTPSSVFRGKAYNKAVGGSRSSRHMKCLAIDVELIRFTPRNHDRLCREAAELRRAGLFKGGLGFYESFLHIDVDPGGRNRTWGPLKDRYLKAPK